MAIETIARKTRNAITIPTIIEMEMEKELEEEEIVEVEEEERLTHFPVEGSQVKFEQFRD